ncbi:MAG: amidohydrolase family protein [Planctomycetota bacterium]
MNPPPVTRFRAAAVIDAAGVRLDSGGAVAVQDGRVVAAGDLDNLPAGETVDLGDVLLTPAHVNAHAHLELTAVGTRPYPGGFVEWVRLLQTERPQDDDAVYTSVREGCELLRDAGVGYVGDIGGGRYGQTAVARALRDARTQGVAFAEIMGLRGEQLDAAMARLETGFTSDSPADVPHVGLQPHAPYSTCPALYQACVDTGRAWGLPLCTHLAEMIEEARFVSAAEGPFRDFVEELGLWADDLFAHYGQGLSPVQWIQPFLAQAPWLLAHCNYVSDDDIAILARHGASVAYCPIASEYFGHPHDGHPPHRYRDLMAAGVNVCLGTDSLVCQPGDEPHPLGLLPVMRRLRQRDGVDPATLLAMATTRGHRALGSLADNGTLAPGAPARFTLIDLPPGYGSASAGPLAAAIDGTGRARLFEPRTPSTPAD